MGSNNSSSWATDVICPHSNIQPLCTFICSIFLRFCQVVRCCVSLWHVTSLKATMKYFPTDLRCVSSAVSPFPRCQTNNTPTIYLNAAQRRHWLKVICYFSVSANENCISLKKAVDLGCLSPTPPLFICHCVFHFLWVKTLIFKNLFCLLSLHPCGSTLVIIDYFSLWSYIHHCCRTTNLLQKCCLCSQSNYCFTLLKT